MASIGDLVVRLLADTSDFRKGIGQAQTSLTGFTGTASKLLPMLGAAGLAGAITGAAVASLKFAADFDSGMRQVTSLLGLTSQEADKVFREMSKGVLDLSKRLGIDAVVATKALYEAISAGVPRENAITFLEIASKAAIAGVTNTKVAVDGLTTVMNSYKLGTESAQKISDAMFQAVNIGKVTFEQLAASVGQAANSAAQAGVDYQELLAAMATITKQGISASEAFTQINAALRSLTAPSDEMKAIYERMGVSSGTLLVKSKGLEGALQAVRDAVKGNASVLQEAMGRQEGYKALLSLTGASAKMAADDLTTMRNSAGAADNAFREMEKSTKRQFEVMISQLKVIGIELGDVVLPYINKLLSAFNSTKQSAGTLGIQFATRPGAGFKEAVSEAEAYASGTVAAEAKVAAARVAGATAAAALANKARALAAEERAAAAALHKKGEKLSELTPATIKYYQELAKVSAHTAQASLDMKDFYFEMAFGTFNTEALSEEIRRLTLAEQGLNVEQDALNRVLGAYLKPAKDAAEASREVSKIMGGMGLKSTADLRNEADRLGAEWGRLLALQKRGQAEVLDTSKAYEKWQEALRNVAGISGREVKPALKEVSTILTNMNQQIADAIVNWKGFGDTAISILKRIGSAIIAEILQNLIFTEKRMKAITDALGGLLGKIPGLGGIFGGATKAGGQAAGQVAGGIGSAAGGVGGAAGGPAAGVAGGIMGTIGAVGAAVGAVSGIIGNFQMRGMNQSLGRIEESTRFSMSFLETLESHTRLMIEGIWDVARRLENPVAVLLMNINDALRVDLPSRMNEIALATGGGLTINVSNNTFSGMPATGAIDQLLDLLVERLRQRGIRP